jgi:hypothetical protein
MTVNGDAALSFSGEAIKTTSAAREQNARFTVASSQSPQINDYAFTVRTNPCF